MSKNHMFSVGGVEPAFTKIGSMYTRAKMNAETRDAVTSMIKRRAPVLQLPFGNPGDVKRVKLGKRTVVVFCVSQLR